MIVSHRHRFIFFAVPRTATHSIRQALREHLDEHDWEQQMLTARRHLPVPGLARLGHGHVSFRDAAAHLPREVWHGYFRFAFVRDPFDRLVSVCSFLNRGNPHYRGNETAFMKRAMATARFRRRVLVRPQCELLTDEDGTLAVHRVGRFEHLQTDFDGICRHLGLPVTGLPLTNGSARVRPAGYYDPALASTVAQFYEADFRRFGYPAGLRDPAGQP